MLGHKFTLVEFGVFIIVEPGGCREEIDFRYLPWVVLVMDSELI